MKVFSILAITFALNWAMLTQASATTVAIDDSADTLTVSIDGVNITSASQSVGNCPGGCQNVTNFLIETGSANSAESASVQFDDFTLVPSALPEGTVFFSKVLYLTEAGSAPGVPPVISDEVTVTVSNVGVALQIGLTLDSDFGETGLPACTAGIPPGTNCVNLGQETGDFQDITAAALTNMLGPGFSGAIEVPGLTLLIRSDATEITVPEPSTLLLLAVALAVPAAWSTRRNDGRCAPSSAACLFASQGSE